MRRHLRARQSHAAPDRGERARARSGRAFGRHMRGHIATREPQPRIARVRTRGDGRCLARFVCVRVERRGGHTERAVRARHEPLRVKEAGGGVLRPKGQRVAAIMPEHTSDWTCIIDSALDLERTVHAGGLTMLNVHAEFT
jgi:hypothetical protein